MKSKAGGNFLKKMALLALAGVAQWIECWPVNQRVTSLIPSQGTCLGSGPEPVSYTHLRAHETLSTIFKNTNKKTTLAHVAQWIECWPVNQRVTGWIPSQNTCLGCRPGSLQEVHKSQPHTDVSLPLFLPLFPL